MKEYNLKDGVSSSNLPTQYSALGKLKNFFRLELTPKEEKILTEVHNFLFREVEFPELRDFLYQEIDLSGVKDFWCQDVNFKEVKDFWCQEVDLSGVKNFWFQDIPWNTEIKFRK